MLFFKEFIYLYKGEFLLSGKTNVIICVIHKKKSSFYLFYIIDLRYNFSQTKEIHLTFKNIQTPLLGCKQLTLKRLIYI